MKTIAVIGTGIMGNGIASNFLKHDYKVVVWNRSKDRLKDLVSKGAVVAGTPKEAAQKADIIFEVTANDASSRSVWLDKDGIIAGADKNKVLITNATLSIPWVDELAATCAQKGLKFLDMPMTGGRSGAESGKLILLVGGDEKLLTTLEPDLKAISEKTVYFGPTGSGMRYKLILNMLQAIHIAAFGEALKLAEELGLDTGKAGAALAERPGGIPTNTSWRGFQAQPDPINFSIDWITKDLGYASKAAIKTQTPLLDLTLKKYSQAQANGLGQKDWTAINI